MTLATGLLFGSGALVCAIGTLAGFGGGFLMVPILTLAFRVPAHLAVATSLAAIFPSSFLASLVNTRQGLVDFRVVAAVQGTAVLAAVGGSILTTWLPEGELKILFGIVMTLLGLQLSYEILRPPDPDAEPAWLRRLRALPPVVRGAHEGETYEISLSASALLGCLAGVLSGMFGLGGGFLYSPALMRVFCVPPRVAAATSLAMVAITSLAGALSHARLGNLRLHTAAPVIAGFVTGALVASALNRKISDGRRRGLVALATLSAGLVMLLIRR